jgi:hypothetical protein
MMLTYQQTIQQALRGVSDALILAHAQANELVAPLQIYQNLRGGRQSEKRRLNRP